MNNKSSQKKLKVMQNQGLSPDHSPSMTQLIVPIGNIITSNR
jgi:hypothetical protein